MTEDTPNREATSAAGILVIVEKHFDRVLENLEQVQEGLKEEEGKKFQEVKAAIAETRKATGFILEERRKLEQYRKNASGVAYDYALDLNAARAEIRSRLDRLREAAATGEVSE